jgi:signal transduction histidine kinase
MQLSLAPAPPTQNRPDPIEQELADFSYIVSHDLATSFRHVAAFSRLLLVELGEDLTRTQTFYVDHIRNATEKCQAQMEQLLVFSRAQQKELARTRCEATRVMETALLQLSAEAQDAEVSIAPLGQIDADADLLLIAFKHLLSNALRFRRAGAPARVHISSASAPGTWAVRIRDNGIGLPAAFHEKAFRMFFQLHPDEASPSVGAGLTICRRIARRHGGDVRFIEQPDAGACVELKLPLAPP